MSDIQQNSIKAWVLAARPKTLSGAVMPVLIGGALALRQTGADFNVTPFVLCVLFALIMQIDANFINDYYDFKKGTDRADRLGPERACAQGWISMPCMLKGILLTTMLACAVGAPLIYYGGWWMVAVGAICVACCALYTLALSYYGLGDVLVLLFFGIVPVVFTYWCIVGVENLQLLCDALILGVGMGLATDCLLMVNNYRDVNQDIISGKRTFVVMFGARAGELAYLWLGILAVAAVAAVAKLWALLMLPYLLLNMFTFRDLLRFSGRELNKVLGQTARNILVFGILASVAVYMY